MNCPKCGTSANLAFNNRGLEISKSYDKVFMSVRCTNCITDIELEYTCTLCEIDEEV